MIEDTPLVTVYVPCKNYGKYLAQCLGSVTAQLYTRWELILFDEASDDETAIIFNDYKRRFPNRVRVIRNETALGLQAVANMALGRAKGKYMMRLDADDWLDEGALLLMVSKLEANLKIGLVYGNYFYTDSAGQVLGMERRYRLGIEDLAGQLPPHGACTMFRVRSLKAVGGYSEDVNAQDGWELWFKLMNRVGAASLEAPLFYYRQHDKSISRDNDRLLKARSRIFARLGQSLEGGYSPSCLAVIPVRESYPGFDGVPYREYEGRTLLERAISSAGEAAGVSSILVSSKSQSVLDFAAELEADGKVPKHARMLREVPSIGSDKLSMRSIMLQAGEFHLDSSGTYPDVVAFLSLHAVRRCGEHIEKALHVLRITESDSVVSVQEEREPVFSHGTDGLQLLNPGRFHDLAYDRERLYAFNGSIVATWWEVLQHETLLGQKIGYIEMSAKDSLQIKNL